MLYIKSYIFIFKILLFAGIIPSSFKYLSIIVKKLKRRDQSAGNKLNNNLINLKKNWILRDYTQKFSINKRFYSIISVHVPIHKKPKTPKELGYYLAGLIEGYSVINNKITIYFHELNISLAYFIKKAIGYGKVKKINNVVVYYIENIEGLKKIITLINGKLRLQKNIDLINNFIKISNLKEIEIDNKPNNELLLNNYWLAGLIDSDGYFDIDISLKKEINIKINISFLLEMKESKILTELKKEIGGKIDYIENIDIYKYTTTSLLHVKKLINYFNQFHLLSNKHINYLKWRKTYLILLNNIEISEKDIERIKNFKKSLISLKPSKILLINSE